MTHMKGDIKLKVTEVQVRKVDLNNRTKAYATITFDDCFVVRDIRVVDGRNGLFIAMPSRKRPDGEFRDIAHPIRTETRKMIEDAILTRFHEEDDLKELEPENTED